MKQKILAFLLLFVGFLILSHQDAKYGTWFELDQFLHHENLAAALLAFAGGFFSTHKTKRRVRLVGLIDVRAVYY